MATASESFLVARNAASRESFPVPWVPVSSYERIFYLHEQLVEKVYDEVRGLSRFLALNF
jgi:hypothetical protein